jgi:L-ascorbate metabolism protein UlaG (beta-lactamase superfamily)
MSQVSADIVTVSHQHEDHNAVDRVKPTTRREKSFVIDSPGEYELLEISVIGRSSFHDSKNGEERGKNTMMIITVDGIKVAHLGDLGHVLNNGQLEEIRPIDILLIPVGGFYTIGPKQAVEVTHAIEPSIVVPMHFKTKHHSDTFVKLDGVETFLKEIGQEDTEVREKLSVTSGSLPEELEVVVLKQQ